MINPNCPLCKADIAQTSKHVLSNCPSPIALTRYTARHNEILQILVSWLRTAISPEKQLLADLPNSDERCTSKLFHSYRPDIAICDSVSVNTLELTICHETSMPNSRNYKINKYAKIQDSCTPIARGKIISNFTIEISTIGFIAPLTKFVKTNKLPPLPTEVKTRIIRAVLNNSFKIYCNRNSV